MSYDVDRGFIHEVGDERWIAEITNGDDLVHGEFTIGDAAGRGSAEFVFWVGGEMRDEEEVAQNMAALHRFEAAFLRFTSKLRETLRSRLDQPGEETG